MCLPVTHIAVADLAEDPGGEDADRLGIIRDVVRACDSAVRERYGNLYGIGKEMAFRHPDVQY